MAEFFFPSEWGDAPPPPSPEIDPDRIESLQNGFLAATQQALHSAPDAFYRTTGQAAVEGAPVLQQRLSQMRDDALAQAKDDNERAALAPRLDANLTTAGRKKQMSEPERTALHELLPVLRLTFFELIWDAFPWIQSIWIKESNRQFHLFVEARTPQDQKERDDLDYLVGETIAHLQKLRADLMPSLATYKIEHTIDYGPKVPEGLGYQELMSDRWFKKIAKKLHPGDWRKAVEGCRSRHRPIAWEARSPIHLGCRGLLRA